MLILHSPLAAKHWCQEKRRKGQAIGAVFTMGALHDGHASLLQRARVENDLVIASLFINPLQFDDPEDYQHYPRNSEKDHQLLKTEDCDMVFHGKLTEFFPEGAEQYQIQKENPGVHGLGLEGDYRPGHLAGVKSIVRRLFQVLGQGRAYFGEKDFQQYLVVKELAASMGYPQVCLCPTVRDGNGLALSSRNAHLTNAEMNQASGIYTALQQARIAWQHGERDPEVLRQILRKQLSRSGLEIEYADLRDPRNWQSSAPTSPMRHARAFIAIRIAGIRLIDNLSLDNPEP